MTRIAREPLEYVATFHLADLEVYERVFHGRRLGRGRICGKPSGMFFSPKTYRHPHKTLDHRHPSILRSFTQRRKLPGRRRTAGHYSLERIPPGSVCSPPLGGWLLGANKQEHGFAIVLDAVDLIDVGRIVLAKPTLHNIHCLVPGAVDRVIAVVTEEHVRTGIAVYAVVTVSANHRVVACPSVEHVRGC